MFSGAGATCHLLCALQNLSGLLRGQYRLTYEGAAATDKKLEVTVARPGAKVRVAQPRS